MTIEKSPAPTANATSSSQSANRSDSKGKAGNDDGSGGFGAILGALDNAPAAPAADAAPATDTAAKNPKPTKPTKAGAATDTTVVDANTLLQQNPQIAAAQAQQAAADAAAAAAAAQAAGSQAPADPATLAQQAALNAALAQQAAGAQPASQLPNPAQTQTPVAARAPARGLPGTADSTVALDTSATPNAAQSLLQGHAKQGKGALQAGADSAAQSSQTTQTTSTATSAQTAAAERADAAKFMASLQQAQGAQGNRALESTLAPLVAKTDKPQTERTGQTAKSADPTYAGTALGVSGPDTTQSTVAASAVPPEMQVAEQVSYWVSQNVQNAELKLDGLGQTPVAVSISVQGNEAQISFRSDDLATRDMLQNSGAHLKDMLQREGLTLTGVSVGTSGSGDAQAREQSGRQNVRQGVIAPLQVSNADTAPRLRSGTVSATGRSVDLFV